MTSATVVPALTIADRIATALGDDGWPYLITTPVQGLTTNLED